MTVTREQFEQDCKRRFGRANPERMRVAHWAWMVRSGEGPYSVRQRLGLEGNYSECGEDGVCRRPEPDWCFQRMGMTRTAMADGRIICIGGEHEDWYDPDFCIYNEVVVLRPAAGREAVTTDSGEVEIYGYPEEVFAPTDFHSATLVDGRIYVIGRVGYGEARAPGTTPIVTVETEGYRISAVSASGACPGWINSHHASFDAGTHAIIVRGGKVLRPGAGQFEPNHAAHRLRLADLRWEVIAEHEPHRMFRIQAVRTLEGFEEPGEAVFRPRRVAYGWLLPEERGVTVYGLDVQGVRVEFESFYTSIRVKVEGGLAGDAVETLLEDVLENLNAGGKAEWEVREMRPDEEW
ncbi:MAG: hypothetical protein ACK4WH_02610 [Phycisphaerales bacterium]